MKRLTRWLESLDARKARNVWILSFNFPSVMLALFLLRLFHASTAPIFLVALAYPLLNEWLFRKFLLWTWVRRIGDHPDDH